MSFFKLFMDSPLGELRLIASTDALVAVLWPEQPDMDAAEGSNAVLENTIAQLRAYLEGSRTTFDLPLAAAGTEFQQATWRALRGIPYSATTSYGTLAEQLEPALQRKTSPRAVGSAVGKNPLSIIVPCHRVVGSNGQMTGFAGGLERKRWLLKHEGVAIA